MDNQNKNTPPVSDPKVPPTGDPTVTPPASDAKPADENAKTAPAAPPENK